MNIPKMLMAAREPLNYVGELSVMCIVVIMIEAPIANPIMNLPINKSEIEEANAKMRAPPKYKISVSNNPRFLPSLSAN